MNHYTLLCGTVKSCWGLGDRRAGMRMETLLVRGETVLPWENS